MELPKIISVDDHVVEPAARLADLAAREVPGEGPARRAQALGRVPAEEGRQVRDDRGSRRRVGRRLDLRGQGHLRAEEVRRDPEVGDEGRRRLDVRQDRHDDDRDHLRRHAPGLLGRQGAQEGLRDQLGRRLAPVPDVPAVLRPDVQGGRRPASSRWRASQAYNDWMVEEWCDPSIGINIPLCIIPLWDVELAAQEIQRNAARGVRAVCFSELPTAARPAEHPHRLLGPDVRRVQRHRHHRVHARRLVVDRPVLVAGRAARRRAAWSRSTTRWRRSATTSSAGSCTGSRS